MDLRASSTTLDVVLFVLLVGVAVGTLAGAQRGDSGAPDRVGAETADVLATSTTTVSFSRSGRIQRSGTFHGVTVDRRAHGTYAELLAAATVANPSLGTRSLTGSGGDLRDEVVNATDRALPTGEANVAVRATWRPYGRGSLGETVVAGDPPPPDADVSVARVTVPSGFPAAADHVSPQSASYETVARAVARSLVTGLFPADETADALASEGPDRVIVASRYRTAFATAGVSPDGALGRGDVAVANERLVEALTDPIRSDLERSFESPAAAARAVAVDEVRIVVRTWSP